MVVEEPGRRPVISRDKTYCLVKASDKAEDSGWGKD